MKGLRLAGDVELAALLQNTHTRVRGPTGYGEVVNTDTPHETWKAKEAAASAAQAFPLVGLCRAAGLPEPIPEYRFHADRKWRFDYAWPEKNIAVEVEGGVWTQGRHTRGSGFIADMEKYNAAAKLRWFVLRYTPDDLMSAIEDVRGLLVPEAAFR